MGLPLYDYVIHVGIIATTRVPLITGFQPPLVLTLWTTSNLGLIASRLQLLGLVASRETCSLVLGLDFLNSLLQLFFCPLWYFIVICIFEVFVLNPAHALHACKQRWGLHAYTTSFFRKCSCQSYLLDVPVGAVPEYSCLCC